MIRVKIERLAGSRKALAFGLLVAALATVMVMPLGRRGGITGVAFAVDSTGAPSH
jgi:hypothetical protein